MSIRIIEDYNTCQELTHDWDRLLKSVSESILQLDVTSTLEWSIALWENFAHHTKQRVLVLENNNCITGILPLYNSYDTIYSLRCRKIAPITEIYSGRCGFMLSHNQEAGLDTMIKYLYQHSDWDLFQITLVDGSQSDTLFREVYRQRKFRCDKLAMQSSPYIALKGDWKKYFDSLPKKFRWRLRNSTKKLEESGRLVHKEFGTETDLQSFFDSMIEVEKESWKESAGTSITVNTYQETFYKKFSLMAANKGWFYSHVLELDDIPIAYLYGLAYNGVFFNLKSSYKEEYKKYSPGHVLKMFILEQLYQRGIRVYDFMGPCDDHKMRWTNKIYTRSTYIIYNNTLRGIAAWMGRRVKYCFQRDSSQSRA